jgi:large conductance mechanosensitive channel
MLKEFKAFIMRGNVLDLAVAVIIGGAFGKIVSSLVQDVIMPPIGLALGNVDFTNLYINLSKTDFASRADAIKAGVPTISYGVFLNTVIDFLIVAFVIFLVIRAVNRMERLAERHKPPVAPPAPTTRDCPYCLSSIPLKATRCAHCTSELKTA